MSSSECRTGVGGVLLVVVVVVVHISAVVVGGGGGGEEVVRVVPLLELSAIWICLTSLSSSSDSRALESVTGTTPTDGSGSRVDVI